MGQPTPATLTASYSGVNATTSVTVDPPTPSISVSPSTIVSGQSATGTVTLTSPAGSSGVSVALSSSNTTAASVPSTVTVPFGATSVTFTVTAGTVSSSTAANLTASYSGVNATFGVTINPPPAALSSVSVTPSTIVSGQTGTGTVNLTAAAGTGGVPVALSSSNSAAVSVPSTVMVPQGATSAAFTVTTGAMSSSTSAMLTASYSGVNATVSVTVNPPAAALSSVAVSPSAIVSGGQSGVGTVTLTGPAPMGGATVSLSSSNAAVAWVPSSATIQAGAASTRFTVSPGPVTVSTSVTITATYSSVTETFVLTVNPASSISASPTAVFQGLDTTTQGNWRNTYNYPNVTIIGNGAINATVTPIPSGENSYLWTSSTTLIQALENLASSGRVAGRWASATDFFVNIDFTDQAVHQVAIYCLDWNAQSRAETISVLNAATGAVLDTRSVSNFAGGVYAVWNVTGNVKLQITKTAGPNAVISGVFLK
jgi:hypothetical protein